MNWIAFYIHSVYCSIKIMKFLFIFHLNSWMARISEDVLRQYLCKIECVFETKFGMIELLLLTTQKSWTFIFWLIRWQFYCQLHYNSFWHLNTKVYVYWRISSVYGFIFIHFENIEIYAISDQHQLICRFDSKPQN